MTKKRKTKKEKLIAELRHKLASKSIDHSSDKNDTYVKENIEHKEEKRNYFTFQSNANRSNQLQASKSFNSSGFNFVTRDLYTTALLTGAIIALEIILFIFLKNKIVEIPNLSF